MRIPILQTAVVGLALYGSYKTYRYLTATPSGDDMQLVPLPAGVTGNSGVKCTAVMAAFLERLKATVPTIPLHVTSGLRTYSEQASAMITKFDLAEKKGKGEGAKELYKIYAADDVVTAVLAAPKSVSSWASVIESQTLKGRILSRHLGGRGIDLRTSNLTGEQTKQLIAAVSLLGSRPLLEDTPPHLHIDILGS
jgi:hypothetical protein